MNQLSEGVQTELWENFSLRQVASLILHIEQSVVFSLNWHTGPMKIERKVISLRFGNFCSEMDENRRTVQVFVVVFATHC